MPEPALDHLGEVVARRAVAGGDINRALRVELADGRVLFVKHGAAAGAGFYAAEAAGLEWLREGPLPVPSVVEVAEDHLALAWVDSAPRAPGFGAALGEGLARLHALGAAAYGAPGPTFIGTLELPNAAAADWPAFYGEQRLAPLLRYAAGALPDGCAARVERLIGRLGDLCGPAEPIARLHGDLWSGNVMAGPAGEPWLVDPAAYGGHREIDLAMLELFGAPGAEFYAAYDDVWPRADGSAERMALNQVLPLLVHAALFGGGYGAAVDRAVRQYV
jgi:fructosamine-3-kinase